MRNVFAILFLAATLLPSAYAQSQPGTMPGTQSQALSQGGLDRITKEVRHELLLLPYYGVFDNLQYRVAPDGTVTLIGQVVRPTLKSDAENAVTQGPVWRLAGKSV